jgi:hypothetical protein
MSGSILLGQVADHLVTLEIACNRCERNGRAAVDRLITQHGPLMSIPTLLALLSADCQAARRVWRAPAAALRHIQAQAARRRMTDAQARRNDLERYTRPPALR